MMVSVGCGVLPPPLPPPQPLSSTKAAAVTAPVIQRIGTNRVITPPAALLCSVLNNESSGHELDTSKFKNRCRTSPGHWPARARQMFWLPVRCWRKRYKWGESSPLGFSGAHAHWTTERPERDLLDRPLGSGYRLICSGTLDASVATKCRSRRLPELAQATAGASRFRPLNVL